VFVLVAVVVLTSVAELLAPGKPFVVGRGGPVPAGGSGTTYVKCADRRAVVEKEIEFVLGGHAPVIVAAEFLGIRTLCAFLGAVESVGQRYVLGHRGFTVALAGALASRGIALVPARSVLQARALLKALTPNVGLLIINCRIHGVCALAAGNGPG
jgi:hypothetical protein